MALGYSDVSTVNSAARAVNRAARAVNSALRTMVDTVRAAMSALNTVVRTPNSVVTTMTSAVNTVMSGARAVNSDTRTRTSMSAVSRVISSMRPVESIPKSSLHEVLTLLWHSGMVTFEAIFHLNVCVWAMDGYSRSYVYGLVTQLSLCAVLFCFGAVCFDLVEQVKNPFKRSVRRRIVFGFFLWVVLPSHCAVLLCLAGLCTDVDLCSFDAYYCYQYYELLVRRWRPGEHLFRVWRAAFSVVCKAVQDCLLNRPVCSHNGHCA